MVIIKKKKSAKQRGTRTHGWGAGKKHRGAGHRGGKGNAGFGKRGQQRLTKAHANKIKTLGKRKTHPHIKKIKKIITIKEIDAKFESWISEKKIKKQKDVFTIDLSELGYDKLLGTGKLYHKLKIHVNECTEIARKKIEALNGTVTSKLNEEGNQ